MDRLHRAPDGLHAAPRAALDETIAATALGLERALSVGRAVFFAAILVRFFLVAEVPLPGLLMTTSVLAVGILFSLYVLVFVRRPPRRDRLWMTSVGLDAAAVLGALLPNALWPTPEYVGVLYGPDASGMLIAIFAAGLRLSPRAAVLGCVANTLALVVLVEADRFVSGVRLEASLQTASLSVVLSVTCGAVAVILAVATRRLVRRGALAALRADRAEQGLGTVLADHHDLGSLLTSVLINADLLASAVEKGEASDGHDAQELARDLVLDLRQVRAVVDDVRGRALGDLSAFEDRKAVSLRRAADRVAKLARARFGDVAIELAGIPEDLEVLVVGGAPTLHRVLLNLVVNACEGARCAGPSTVALAARSDPALGTVEVVVEDDGPGLPDSVLAGGRGEVVKPDGIGIGLAVVRGLTEASGGTVRIENRDRGGVRVSLTLLAAPT